MDFTRKVWVACTLIPESKVSTYGEIAKAVGEPKAVRAVGNALNKSPGTPEVPCHRVVKSNGELGGFAKGRAAKETLLWREGIKVKDGRVVNFPQKLFLFH